MEPGGDRTDITPHDRTVSATAPTGLAPRLLVMSGSSRTPVRLLGLRSAHIDAALCQVVVFEVGRARRLGPCLGAGLGVVLGLGPGSDIRRAGVSGCEPTTLE